MKVQNRENRATYARLIAHRQRMAELVAAGMEKDQASVQAFHEVKRLVWDDRKRVLVAPK